MVLEAGLDRTSGFLPSTGPNSRRLLSEHLSSHHGKVEAPPPDSLLLIFFLWEEDEKGAESSGGLMPGGWVAQSVRWGSWTAVR